MLGIFISHNLIFLNSFTLYSNIIILFRNNYSYIILSEMLIVQNFFYVSKLFSNQILTTTTGPLDVNLRTFITALAENIWIRNDNTNLLTKLTAKNTTENSNIA